MCSSTRPEVVRSEKKMRERLQQARGANGYSLARPRSLGSLFLLAAACRS